jgi:hypothetical protein
MKKTKGTPRKKVSITEKVLPLTFELSHTTTSSEYGAELYHTCPMKSWYSYYG